MDAPEYCILGTNWWATCMTKSEWSGWVQAIGSILALAFGFVLLFVQQSLHQQAQRREKLQGAIEEMQSLLDKLNAFSLVVRFATQSWALEEAVDVDATARLRTAFAVVRDSPRPGTLRAVDEQLWLMAHAAAHDIWTKSEFINAGLTGSTLASVREPMLEIAASMGVVSYVTGELETRLSKLVSSARALGWRNPQ